jgi:hypothetical protein
MTLRPPVSTHVQPNRDLPILWLGDEHVKAR